MKSTRLNQRHVHGLVENDTMDTKSNNKKQTNKKKGLIGRKTNLMVKDD